MTPFEVTDNPPEWSLPGSGKAGTKEYFYVQADVSRKWPLHAPTTLCKFGVTDKNPKDRCRENQRDVQRKWDITADLEVVFVATGTISYVEQEVRDHTLRWLPQRFERNAEWRLCCPRQLARVAVLIAEKRFRSGYV